MRPSRVHLHAVLDAAERLLAAREDAMITAEEWDALQSATALCSGPSTSRREETFLITDDGAVLRRVTPARGDPYEHRCPAAAFEAAARAVQHLATGITGERVRALAEITWTEAAVALAFLRERGVVVPAGRRVHAVAGPTAFEDAMIEYHALRGRP